MTTFISSVDSTSLYLHIPFCRTKCTYCAFNTYVNLDALIEPFVLALIHEIEILGASNADLRLGTVYLGGGTPSLLTPAQIQNILAAVEQQFSIMPDAEITLEANPNDLDFPYLEALRALGINRLSIGMQSAHSNELKLFARRHDNDMALQAVSAARQAGFDNLNLDLMYGFPHQTLSTWEASLQQMLALQPEHVSLYALGLEEGTPLASWVAKGQLASPDDDLAADMYELATEVLAESVYEQYEISNWSKLGFSSRHNLQYWRNLPYIGLGPGAYGYAGGVRYGTILSPQKYVRLLDNVDRRYEFPHTPATDQAVVVDRAGEIAETLIMGLRLTKEGIRRSTFYERFGIDVLDLHRPTIDKYVGYALLYVDAEVVRLTQEGRLLSNAIFRDLI